MGTQNKTLCFQATELLSLLLKIVAQYQNKIGILKWQIKLFCLKATETKHLDFRNAYIFPLIFLTETSLSVHSCIMKQIYFIFIFYICQNCIHSGLHTGVQFLEWNKWKETLRLTFLTVWYMHAKISSTTQLLYRHHKETSLTTL